MFFQIPELSTACVMLMSDFLFPGGAWGDLLVCVPLEAPSFSRVGKEMEEERIIVHVKVQVSTAHSYTCHASINSESNGYYVIQTTM